MLPLSRPFRPLATRPVAVLAPVVLALTLLAGCGSSTSADSALGSTAQGLDAVTLGGDVGSVPTVEWKANLAATTPQAQTLVTGTGQALASGDSAFVNYWVADGTTRQTGLFNTFGKDGKPAEITLGQPSTTPASLDDLVTEFLATQLKDGATVGTRIAIAVGATNMLGQTAVFAPDSLKKNIGNDDGLLVVVDVVSGVLSGPSGAQHPVPSWSPRIVFDKQKDPTGLNFAGTPALGDKLKVGVLKTGTGAVVKSGDTIVVDYLGQVYQGAKAFDESYSKMPFSTTIGSGSVIKGWDQGLVGLHVGTRVVLGIPSALGYGTKGQGDTIPANSNLYFVIDILGAA